MDDTNCERVPYEGRGIRRRNGNGYRTSGRPGGRRSFSHAAACPGAWPGDQLPQLRDLLPGAGRLLAGPPQGFQAHQGLGQDSRVAENFLFLMAVAFLEFPTSLVGHYSEEQVSVVIYDPDSDVDLGIYYRPDAPPSVKEIRR